MFHRSLDLGAVSMIPAACQRMTSPCISGGSSIDRPYCRRVVQQRGADLAVKCRDQVRIEKWIVLRACDLLSGRDRDDPFPGLGE